MPTRLELIEAEMGVDLRLEYRSAAGFFENADLAEQIGAGRPSGVDVATAAGLDNFRQAVANRLKTRQGELAALGHPGYGSRHHELIGEPNVERTRRLIKLYVLQALRDEPRIESVEKADVMPDPGARDAVRIELLVKPIDHPNPINLIVPFSLGGEP